MPRYIIICDRPYQSHAEVGYCETAINQSEHHIKFKKAAYNQFFLF